MSGMSAEQLHRSTLGIYSVSNRYLCHIRQKKKKNGQRGKGACSFVPCVSLFQRLFSQMTKNWNMTIFFSCNFCSGNMLWMHVVCFKFWEHFLITLEIWVLGCLSAPWWEGEFVLINTDWIKDRLYWFSFRWVLKVFYDFQKLNRDCSVIFFFYSSPKTDLDGWV